MSQKDTLGGTIKVAVILSLLFSVVISTAAVVLKPIQMENRALDLNRSILKVAGFGQDSPLTGKEISTLMSEKMEARLVDLDTGEFVDDVNGMSVDTYDQRKAEKDPALSKALNEDPAGIKRREKYAKVYILSENDEIKRVVLPVRGYGLWSTLRGFLSLESDLETVGSLEFYEHAETPGLGGEVDNPLWKGLWPGKKVYDDTGKVALRLKKGKVVSGEKGEKNMVDGLAGSTLTSNGVTNLVQYWLKEDGYQKFLEKLKEES
jgi:Na+-transporting NADH:ubiquinone oxidoreductase subunit C